MPIYEYLCQACGDSTEALRKLSDPPLTRCPACGEEALKKKVSAAAFRLKGGGWYETDFKTGGKKNIAGDGGDAPRKEGGGDGGKDAGKAAPDGKAGSDSKAGDKKAATEKSKPTGGGSSNA